jgi:predicted  nucleic acid-binding Zn-ribbon protein
LNQRTKTNQIEEAQYLKTKNKNERLTREVVDKEQTVLDLQNKCTRLEQENGKLREMTDLAQTKLKALETFSSELQQKHD